MKYFLSFVLVIVIMILVVVTSILYNIVKPQIHTYASSPDFSFAVGGDIGGNDTTSATLDLVAKSSASFYLAVGDLDYGDILPEPSWCAYIQSHVGSRFP